MYQLFEREFGAKVIEDNYGSNEDMRAKLQAGGAVYDLVVPSDYMVVLLRKEDLLLPIDLTPFLTCGIWGSVFAILRTILGITIRCPTSGDHRHRLQQEPGDAAACTLGRPVRAIVDRAL